VEAPGYEDRAVGFVDVGEPAAVGGHAGVVSGVGEILKGKRADRGVGCGPGGPPHCTPCRDYEIPAATHNITETMGFQQLLGGALAEVEDQPGG
jgi:hypothetical protein